MATQTLYDLITEYGLPLDVKKPEWSEDYFFRAEIVEDTLVLGTIFLDGEENMAFRYSLQEKMQLCYSSNETEEDFPDDESLEEDFPKELIDGLPNPNKLDLNARNYIKGVTKLFVIKNDVATPAVFDHFSVEKGQLLIYLIKDGESKPGFYRFPQTPYIFPNKDDAQQRTDHENRDKENRQYGLSPTEKIVAAYSKKIKARVPSQNKSTENTYERDYHSKVDGKLADDILIPEKKQKEAQDDIKRANEKIREEYAVARENGCGVDDHAIISHRRTMDLADGRIAEAKDKILKIKQIRKEPYFARIDCGATMQDLHTVYLGEEDIDGFVVSWRNPDYGNVYHKSGIFQGRDDIALALKRVFTIKNGQYEGFDDEICLYGQNGNEDYSGITDALLTKLLKESRLDKHTHDIIKTIQSEQYDIITSDFTQNAIINGCAGSGKTMIMYHRLSYMAYNYPAFLGKPFEPDNVYIISPSKYFDLSNDELLTQLSIDSVHQSPFYDQVKNLADKYCYAKEIIPFQGLIPYVNAAGSVTLSDEFFSTPAFNAFNTKLKNVNNEEDAYHQWIISFANELLKAQGFAEISPYFHPTSNADITAFFANSQYYFNNCFEKKSSEKKNLPKEDKKYFSKTVVTSVSLENILASLDKTSSNYQKRIKRINKHLGLLKCALSLKTKKSSIDTVVTDISDFWGLFENATIFEKMITLISVEKLLNALLAKKSDNTYLTLKMLYVYFTHFDTSVVDFIPVYFLRLLTKKFGSIIEEESLVFIDEFQNYSSFELESFKNAFSSPIFNLFGDYDQRIEDKGTDLKSKLVTLLNPNSYNININYRNAKQITEYINQAVHKNMQSINVEGSVIETNIDNCDYEISDRTAIVCKDIKLALLFLKRYIDISLINNVVSTQELLTGKFNLMTVLDSKGLEFETVYVLDYGMSDNEKYVAYTRALNKLVVISDNLDEIKKREAQEQQRIKQEKERNKLQELHVKLISTIQKILLIKNESENQLIEERAFIVEESRQITEAKKQIESERVQLITAALGINQEKAQLNADRKAIEDESRQVSKDKTKLEVDRESLKNEALQIEREKKQLQADREVAVVESRRINEAQEKLEDDRESLKAEALRIESDKKQLQADREATLVESRRINKVQEKLEVDRESLNIEALQIENEKKQLQADREDAIVESRRINEAREKLEVDRETLKAEAIRIESEKKQLQTDREATVIESRRINEAWEKLEVDRESLKAEAIRIESEKKQLQIEREAIDIESHRIHENPTKLETDFEKLQSEVAHITQEKKQLQIDRAELETERHRIAEEKQKIKTERDIMDIELRHLSEDKQNLEHYRSVLKETEENIKINSNNQKEKIYLLAISKSESEDISCLSEAMVLFESVIDYKNASGFVSQLRVKIKKITKSEEERKSLLYNECLEIYNNSCDIKELIKAIVKLEPIIDWKSSKQLIRLIQEKIDIEVQKYEYRIQRVCQHCGGEFKGAFTKTCSVCGKVKDY